MQCVCFYILMGTKRPHKVKSVRDSYLQRKQLLLSQTCSSHLKSNGAKNVFFWLKFELNLGVDVSLVSMINNYAFTD